MSSLLSEKLIHALGWTLLHSLWQAALAALLFYLLTAFRKEVHPDFRYAIATGSLALIAMMAVFTFSYEYFQYKPKTNTATLSENAVAVYHYTGTVPQNYHFPQAAEESKTFKLSFSAITQMADRHITAIVVAWICGVLLLSVRFLGGLAFTRRLKHHAGNIVLEHWQEKARSLSQKIRLNKSVQVVASGMAQVPMVIGHLKPVILLPVSLLASLPSEQIEAILAHELAHIHRKDYWVNILQSLVEIIFFYHPAVWWISAVIRTERENCCDDLAVRLCGSTLTYAKALTRMEESRQASAGMGMAATGMATMEMAATGNKGSLLQRIERLINPHTVVSNSSSKYAVILTLLFLIAISAGSSMAFKTHEIPEDGNLAGAVPHLISHQQSSAWAAIGQLRYLDLLSDERKSNKKDRPLIPTHENRPNELSTTALAPLEMKTSLTDTLPPLEEEEDNQDIELDLDINLDTLLDLDIDMDMDLDIAIDSVFEMSYDTLSNGYFFSFPGDSSDRYSFKMIAPDTLWNYNFNLSPAPAPMPVGMDTLLPPQVFYYTDSLVRHYIYPLDSMHDFHLQWQDSTFREQMEKAMKEAEKHIKMMHMHFQDSLTSFDYSRMQERLERSQEVLKRQSEALARQAEALKKRAEVMERKARELEERAKEKAEARENSFEQSTRLLEKELLKDGLIKKGREYKFELSEDQLKINGKKQGRNVYQKYADLLAKEMNVKLEKGNKFSLTKTPY